MKICYLDLDDFGEQNNCLDWLWRLQKEFPKFKVNLFAIPWNMQRKPWRDYLKSLDWIQLCVHGFYHEHNEEISEAMLKRNFPANGFVKVYRAPYWQLSDRMYERLKKLGYKIMLHPDDPRQGIKYNWNIKDSPPSLDILYGHGHIQDYPPGPKGNGLIQAFENIMKLPKDTEFGFLSETLKRRIKPEKKKKGYEKWYSPSIYETYMAAIEEHTGLSREEIQEKGSNAAHNKFRDSFTPEITASYKKTKEHYAKSRHYMFRNPPYFRGRLQTVFGKYADVIKTNPGPLLDYGCGAGIISEYFYREGIKDITLADLPGKTWDFVKFFFGNRVKYEKDVENIQGKYKYIFSNSVLEHIHDPLKVVNMWSKHLLPGGKILGGMARDVGGEHLEVSINQYHDVVKRIEEINKGEYSTSKTLPEVSMFKAILIETQQGCNYKCISCPTKYIKNTGKKMSWKLFKKIIDQLKDFDGRISPYFTNEPLLDKRLPDMIRYIKENTKAFVRINTNASVLKGELAKRIVDSGLDGMEVSISAITEKDYQKVHGTKLPLKEVKKNLDNFRKIFRGDLRIYIIEGLTSSTRADFVRFFEGYQIGFAPRVNRGGSLKGRIQGAIRPAFCRPLYRQMYIKPTGKAVACCNDFLDTVILGDCNKQTLMKIWNGKKYNDLRKNLKENKNLPKICKECDGPY